jgi:hypothetical protein
MTENKTSQAVKQWDSFAQATSGTSDIVHLSKDLFIDIAAKYQKFETAMKEIEWLFHGHLCPVCTAAQSQGHFDGCQIGAALSFDPLA